MYTQDAAQQALGFLIEQAAYIEPQVNEVQYPDIQYPNLIPVDFSAPEWAKIITYFSMDKVGKAEWFNHAAKDIPLADVEREKFDQTIHMAAIGYRYDLEEIGQAMMIPGRNLTADKGMAARRAYEEHVEGVAISGDTGKSWKGLINQTAVTSATAANGAGGTPTWENKTPDEILTDFNTALSGVWSSSLQVEMADTVLLPVPSLSLITSKRVTDTNMTVLEFVQRANIYTAQTGQPLMVRALRQLIDAGDGDTGRMIAYRRDPQVLKLHIPMPHRFLPVWQTGPITFDVPGIFRLGPVEVRRPGAFRYVDGIYDGGT